MQNPTNTPPQPEHESYIRRRLEQVAMFAKDPNASEILDSGALNPLRAIVLRAVMATPGLPDFLYRHMTAPGYRKSDLNIIGIGYNAVTVDDGPDAVRKYYRRTAGQSESFQQATLDIWRSRQDIILEHLGAYAVPQVFSIDSNPLNPRESIITAAQERIRHQGTINVFDLTRIPDTAEPFIRDSLLMHLASRPSGVPDLLGRDNLLIQADTGAVKLVDPIPLMYDDTRDRLGYLKIADFLKDFDEETAAR